MYYGFAEWFLKEEEPEKYKCPVCGAELEAITDYTEGYDSWRCPECGWTEPA